MHLDKVSIRISRRLINYVNRRRMQDCLKPKGHSDWVFIWVTTDTRKTIRTQSFGSRRLPLKAILRQIITSVFAMKTAQARKQTSWKQRNACELLLKRNTPMLRMNLVSV